MEQYLKLFKNQAEYDAASEKPQVSHIVEEVDVKMKGDDPCNRYEYVDLGLPSGLKWATKNVGACTEEDCGLLFAWGETQGYTGGQVGTGEGKRYFGWDDYKFGNSVSNLTKYNSTDGKKVLDLEDDAAHVIMGGSWRMPTHEEFIELLDNTTQERIGGQGNDGYWKLTSKVDPSKFIRLNHCGHASMGYYYPGGDSHYISSSMSKLNNPYGSEAILFFNDWYIHSSTYESTSRPAGGFIRGVKA